MNVEDLEKLDYCCLCGSVFLRFKLRQIQLIETNEYNESKMVSSQYTCIRCNPTRQDVIEIKF